MSKNNKKIQDAKLAEFAQFFDETNETKDYIVSNYRALMLKENDGDQAWVDSFTDNDILTQIVYDDYMPFTNWQARKERAEEAAKRALGTITAWSKL